VADPQTVTTTTGKTLCKFRIAAPHSYKRPNEERGTDFWDCTAFGKTSEYVAKYATKGGQAVVIGDMTARTVDTDAGKRVFSDVAVTSVTLVGGGSGNGREDDDDPFA